MWSVWFVLSLVFSGLQAGARAALSWAERTEKELIAALLDGDEQAFSWLVRRYWRSMVRVAQGLVRNEEVAVEVVQETWEAVVKELARFRGEASLKNWIFRILVNRARRVGKKEARTVPFSALVERDVLGTPRSVEDEFTAKGKWRSPVHGWRMIDPQNEAINREGLAILVQAMDKLPETQRVVVTLRDVEGLDSVEVCDLLHISEGNQRVLLHRGRTILRLALQAAEQAQA